MRKDFSQDAHLELIRNAMGEWAYQLLKDSGAHVYAWDRDIANNPALSSLGAAWSNGYVDENDEVVEPVGGVVAINVDFVRWVGINAPHEWNKILSMVVHELEHYRQAAEGELILLKADPSHPFAMGEMSYKGVIYSGSDLCPSKYADWPWEVAAYEAQARYLDPENWVEVAHSLREEARAVINRQNNLAA